MSWIARMPIIHCPGCQRALHLPEVEQGNTVCCPLCKTIFPTPAEEPPPDLPPRPVNVPPRLWGAREERIPPAPGRADAVESPFAFEEDGTELSAEDREEMRKASWWLRLFGITATIEFIACGCLNFPALLREIEGTAFCIAMPLGLQVVGLFFIFRGAEAMYSARKRSLALAACVLTLIFSVVQLIPCLFLLPGRRGGPEGLMCLLGLPIVTGLFGLIGAIRGLTILNKPEVVSYFRRYR